MALHGGHRLPALSPLRGGHRLADLPRAGGGLAFYRIRPASRAGYPQPRLCRGLADHPVRARLSDIARAQRRAWPPARHLRAGDVDDRVPQFADPLVAPSDLDLFDPRRLRAGYLERAGRLLCRPSRLAMAVLAERADRAPDGPDGLLGHAERTGESRFAAR